MEHRAHPSKIVIAVRPKPRRLTWPVSGAVRLARTTEPERNRAVARSARARGRARPDPDALRADPRGEPRARRREDARGGGSAARRSSACRSCSARSTSARARITRCFDLAEPIPGPTTRGARPAWRESTAWSSSRRCSSGAPRACTTTPRSSSTPTARSLGMYRKMHIPDDPLYYEKFYFTPGDLGFRAFDTRVRPHRRAGLLGPVVSRRRAAHRAARAPTCCSIPTAIGWHPSEKAEYGAAQHDAWRTIQRSHAIANGVYVAAVNRVGLRRPAGRRARVLGRHRSSPIRSASCSPRPRARRGGDADRRVRSARASKRCAATGRSCATAASTPTAPITQAARLMTDRAARSADSAALGYRMPAEWEPHAATWLAWPHERADWPGKFAPIPWVYGEIVRHLHAASACASWSTTRRAKQARARVLRKCRRRPGAASTSSASRPTASGRATSCPIFVTRRRRRDVAADRLALQRLGEVRRTGSATTPCRRAARRQLDADAGSRWRAAGASCSKAAASTSTARARC